MSRTRPLTLTITALLALAAGGVAGRWALSTWQMRNALDAIVSADPAVRRSGWERLAPLDVADAELAARLDEIEERLDAAPDDAVRDAATVLRSHDLWSWSQPRRALVMRELALRAAGPDEMDRMLAARELALAPRDLDPDAYLAVVDAVLRSTASETRAAAVRAAATWAGCKRVELLDRLTLAPDDDASRRFVHLAVSWALHAHPAAPPVTTQPREPVDVLEARLLRNCVADPGNATPLLAVIQGWDRAEEPAFDLVLRYSTDGRAARELERRADRGNRAARYALQARRPSTDDAQARRAVEDPEETPTVRRLAAWRWDRIPRDTLARVLDLDPRDSAGQVYAAALLAERRLDRADAVARAETWIRSFNDDEKRAGALLAALLGAHAALLREACAIEDVPAVRTTQRLALWALGEPIGDEDPAEFAYRAVHGTDGDFDADTALCMLLAGAPGALELLTSPPTGDLRRAVQQRSWLIERFRPSWHEAVGRPSGGSERGLRLYFERLDALRALTARDSVGP